MLLTDTKRNAIKGISFLLHRKIKNVAGQQKCSHLQRLKSIISINNKNLLQIKILTLIKDIDNI